MRAALNKGFERRASRPAGRPGSHRLGHRGAHHRRARADELEPERLQNLFDIAMDAVSWRKAHRYLTLVIDHHRRCVVWGIQGASQDAAAGFFGGSEGDRR